MSRSPCPVHSTQEALLILVIKMIVDAFAPHLFNGQTVLVTGGTSGIGLACAQAFRDLGAGVTATGAREAERGRAADAESNAGISFAVLDVRDAVAIDSLVSRSIACTLINAAGVIRRDQEHDPDVFADVLAINLTGTMRVCSAAKPKLGEAQGSVVNVASMLTFFGGPRVPAYSASKGGIGQLTKSLAAAWAGEGVRVNAVAPGWIATPLTQALQDDPERSRPDPVPDAHGPLGHAGGSRRRCGLPGFARGPLRDGRHPGRRRRLSHCVNTTTPQRSNRHVHTRSHPR